MRKGEKAGILQFPWQDFSRGAVMSVARMNTAEVANEPTVADRIADVVGQSAHLSHQARLAKSMARDVGEEGLYAAKRAMRRLRRGVERFEDLKDETAHSVKRQPFKAVGTAAGAGLLLGLVIGWIGASLGHREAAKS
jgi:ElaB/YqjD/DUF883 family membrane-anchored ribosome-binding protein